MQYKFLVAFASFNRGGFSGSDAYAAGAQGFLKFIDQGLRARGIVPFEEVLYRETPALPRGTTLVLISPSTDPKWAQVARHLKRSGLHVTSVVLDAKTFGGPPGSENVIAELGASGIPVSVVKNGVPLEDSLSSPMFAR